MGRLAPEGKNLIYHGACHCEWADVHKIKGQKQLVKALGDFSGLTVSLNPGCCGESGMGAMTSPQIYNLLRSRKQDRLGQAFADGYDGPVVVGCPSCKIGIARSLIKMHDKRPVLCGRNGWPGPLDGEDRRAEFPQKANESRGEIRVIEFSIDACACGVAEPLCGSGPFHFRIAVTRFRRLIAKFESA